MKSASSLVVVEAAAYSGHVVVVINVGHPCFRKHLHQIVEAGLDGLCEERRVVAINEGARRSSRSHAAMNASVAAASASRWRARIGAKQQGRRCSGASRMTAPQSAGDRSQTRARSHQPRRALHVVSR